MHGTWLRVASAATLLESVCKELRRARLGIYEVSLCLVQTRITAVEASRIEYDGARKDLAVAREAQLKHARKTDGQVDGSLQSHDTRAESVLNGVPHMSPASTGICMTSGTSPVLLAPHSFKFCCIAALKSPGHAVTLSSRGCVAVGRNGSFLGFKLAMGASADSDFRRCLSQVWR